MRLPALFALALAMAACAERAEQGASDARTLAPASGPFAVADSRWVGIGEGACALDWAFDLQQEADRVSGRLLLDGLQYDLAGRLDQSGHLNDLRGGKSEADKGRLGPRYVRVTLAFSAREARGHYRLEDEEESCRTAVRLKRFASE